MAVATSERGIYYNSSPQQDGRKPIWHESLVGLEIGVLLANPVYRRGEGIPRGDGSPVMVIPGFLSKDLDTDIFRDWLRRAGYDARSSGILLANTNPEIFEKGIVKEIDRAYKYTGKKTHLIGHSLGGIMVRAIAAKRPEKIKSVTTLGSPLYGEPEEIIDRSVLMLANWLIPILRDRDRLAQRKREISQSLRHKGVRMTSIYTKRDGVVDWRYCVDPDPDTENIEVTSSHAGLIFNHESYKHVGQILAKPQLADITDFTIFSRSVA